MASQPIRVALVGDYDPSVIAHQAIPLALERAAVPAGVEVVARWVPTQAVLSDADIAGYDAVWCVPASPYRSMDGALRAIGFARREGRPFLGTCGGFQHAVLEYARTVLGWVDAEHAETAPDAERLVVAPLECSLVEAHGVVRFRPGTRLAAAYESATGRREAVEGYHCRYGLNPEVRASLISGPLGIAAEDEEGEVRAVELDGHPFFVATLFQPERAALRGVTPPLVIAFLAAAAKGESQGWGRARRAPLR